MSELAINQYGEAFSLPAEAAHWLVRRMHDNKHGGPTPTFGQDGKPITVAVAASMADFQATLRGHNALAGKYRLDLLDGQGRALKGAPIAYLPYPPDRLAAAVADTRGLPRNGNAASSAPVAHPSPAMPVTQAPWSTGGSFPLPVPGALSGAEYLLGEAMRAQTAMLAIIAQSAAQTAAQHTGAIESILTAAAELVRAADGAGLPKRKPGVPVVPPAPQVIVQPVATPVYEGGYADDREAEDEPAAPAAPPAPAWQTALGGVVEQMLPFAQMMLTSKLAEMSGGGGIPDVAAMRNAAPEVEPAPSDDEPGPDAPALDVTPAAWSHLGAVVRRLGATWKARMDAELARMTRDQRTAFVLELVTLDIGQASDRVVAFLAVAEERRARAARPVPADGGSSAAAERTVADVPAVPAPVEADPYAPTAADLPAPHPASGADALRAVRGMVEDAGAPASAAGGGLAGLYDTLVNEGSPFSPLLKAIPGGGATVEAAARLIGPDALDELNAAIDAVPEPPIDQFLNPAVRATATGASLPTAGSATAPRVVSAPAVPMAVALARLSEIMPHLTPGEGATAQTIAMRMPKAERDALLATLVAVPVPEAVAIIRDVVAKYVQHGRPFDRAG